VVLHARILLHEVLEEDTKLHEGEKSSWLFVKEFCYTKLSKKTRSYTKEKIFVVLRESFFVVLRERILLHEVLEEGTKLHEGEKSSWFFVKVSSWFFVKEFCYTKFSKKARSYTKKN